MLACCSSLGALRLLAAMALVGGCGGDDGGGENVLPTTSATQTGSASETDPTVGTTDTGGDIEYPVTYRFDCIDIRQLGDGGPDVLQARLLEQAWSSDIENYKLNILLEVFEVDTDGGTIDLGIRSGVGTGPTSLCAEPTSRSETFSGAFSPGSTQWAPSGDPDTCSVMQSAEGFGEVALELGADDLFYVYAEDDNTVTFNCSTTAGAADAVPIRAVVAEVAVASSQTTLAGTLTGCLLQTEAAALCSCLGSCLGNTGPGDVQEDGVCAGCPTGGVPLEQLLGNIGTSDRCTQIMGAPAFDLQVGFTASALPGMLSTCG
jgi:hypothetical protein